MISEIFGGFILVLTYLTQTDVKHRLCQDDGILMLVISGGYFIAEAASHPYSPLGSAGGQYLWSQSPLNPAIALSITTFATFDGKVKTMTDAWIFLVFSFGGSLAALLFYELGFKRMEKAVIRRDEDIEEEELEREEFNSVMQPISEAM